MAEVDKVRKFVAQTRTIGEPAVGEQTNHGRLIIRDDREHKIRLIVRG